MGPATEFVVTAQNGPSARMLADAAQKMWNATRRRRPSPSVRATFAAPSCRRLDGAVEVDA